jgi:hypothetical protein
MASPSPATGQSAVEVLRLIRTAILERHALRVIYDGLERVLCPQILGRNKNGQARILCLQVGGQSESGLRHQDGQGDWRCLALDKVSGVERVVATWQTGGDSVRRPNCIDQIELEVSPESAGA